MSVYYLAVLSHAYLGMRFINDVIKNVKNAINLSNQYLETDPLFDSGVFRMYIWNLIMMYDEFPRGQSVGQSEGATLIEEFTNNIHRDRSGYRGFFCQE